jgi:hypothetical protein
MKFYIAEKQSRERLLDLDAKRKEVGRLRNRLVKSLKGKGTVSVGPSVRGIVFDGKPPPNWVLSKRLSESVPNTYAPDRSRLGRSIKEQLEELYDPADGWAVGEAVGVTNVLILGRRFIMPQFVVLGGQVIVCLDNAHRPKHCKRISDVEYEALVAKPKRPNP